MTTKSQVLKAIRANCLECCGGSSNEVELCTSKNCNLYQFRKGKDPAPAKAGRAPARAKLEPESSPGYIVDGL